ncbi:unnamed protein product [Durusdinium trenchii]|uniref:Sulfotransferase domain-containing protein n=2 Tax=Durusdinium trenchii TaxID=1381693 RepID=A0ABP0MJF8_9DINO
MSVSSIWLYRLLLLEVLGLIGVYWEIETEFSVSSIRFSSTPLRIGNGGGFLRSMRMQGSPGSPAPAARRLRSDMGAPEAPDFGSQEIRTARLYIQRSDGAVPSLVIVGADKGGTSEAFAMLAREFQVLDPGHKGKKELGCLYEAWNGTQGVHDCYQEYFGQLQHNDDEDVLPVDATPNYYYSNEFYAFDISPPKILAEFAPDATIVFLLREPKSRIQSLYNHWLVSNNRRDLSLALEEQLEEELQFLNGTQNLFDGFVNASGIEDQKCNMWNAWYELRENYQETARNLRRNQTKDVDSKRITSLILTSMYFPFIHTWVQFFDRVAVMQSEYFFEDRNRLWQLLQLSLSSSSPAELRAENQAASYDEKSKLSNDMKERLEQAFQQPNALLFKYLGKLESRGFSVLPRVGASTWWTAIDPTGSRQSRLLA